MREDIKSKQTPTWAAEALNNIARQAAIVAKLRPGTKDHERATRVLLMLQDSLHVLVESRKMIAQAKATLSKKPTDR